MQWFRWYHGTCSDPKLGSIARKTDSSRERVIAVWAMLLESASEANDRGAFAVDADGIADLLNCATASVQAILDEMAARGMVSDGRVTAFASRNFTSDDVTERVRKHRERRRNGDETLRNGEVTPPDTDTDTDTEKSKSKKPRRRASADCSPAFEAFWERWPAHVRDSKREAWTRWQVRESEGYTPEIMQAGAVRYLAQCEALGRYVKNATTFLGPKLHFLEPWPIPTDVVKLPTAGVTDQVRLWLAVCREFDLFTYTGNAETYRAKVERAKASGRIADFDAELKRVRPWERLGDTPEQFVEREIAARLGRIAA